MGQFALKQMQNHQGHGDTSLLARTVAPSPGRAARAITALRRATGHDAWGVASHSNRNIFSRAPRDAGSRGPGHDFSRINAYAPDLGTLPAGHFRREGTGEAVVPSVVREALRSPGHRLDHDTRLLMESRFRHDFGSVRVHTGPAAEQSARAVDADAYTVKRDIVFAPGRYSPRTSSGQRLLSHELAHVVQQEKRGTPGNNALFLQRYPSNTPHGRPYTPGVMHDHRPSGRWSDIQAIESGNCPASLISCTCSTMPPFTVLTTAATVTMRRKPLATYHVGHYLSGGGADYVENVSSFIRRDSGVRGKLASFTASAPRGHFRVEQGDYSEQDFRFAFGAIDRLDYEVDTAAGVVHVWFVDRYEYHPVYPGIYPVMSGDAARVTNCVHAAAVELKASGAADFWMVGYGTVPLSSVTGSAPSGGGPTL